MLIKETICNGLVHRSICQNILLFSKAEQTRVGSGDGEGRGKVGSNFKTTIFFKTMVLGAVITVCYGKLIVVSSPASLSLTTLLRLCWRSESPRCGSGVWEGFKRFTDECERLISLFIIIMVENFG